MRRIKKNIFLGTAFVVVLVLTVVRWVFPSVAEPLSVEVSAVVTPDTALSEAPLYVAETSSTLSSETAHPGRTPLPLIPAPHYKAADGTPLRHRIRGVLSYRRSFPDLQDVQIVAAQRWGVRPVKNRAEAQLRKDDLVFVGSSPYYEMDKKMNRSIPFLVPRAAHLLNTIGRSFLDSLTVKGLPLHTLIVTSVLRTEEDILKLQHHNVNASAQSCHRFGTTFDIAYNRYTAIRPADGADSARVGNDKLKYVLSEVLRDLRQAGLCHIKYEVKQGCFHITVR